VSFSLSQFYSYDENTIQKDWQISCSCFFSILKKNFPSIVLFVLHLRFAKKERIILLTIRGAIH
jgi:hypothetical protein